MLSTLILTLLVSFVSCQTDPLTQWASQLHAPSNAFLWGTKYVPEPLLVDEPFGFRVLSPFELRRALLDESAEPILMDDPGQMAHDVSIIAAGMRYISQPEYVQQLRSVVAEVMTMVGMSPWIIINPDVGRAMPGSATWVERLAREYGLFTANPPLAVWTGPWDATEKDDASRIRTWHDRFASFAQAVAELPQIHLVMLDDFVASGNTLGAEVKKMFGYPSAHPLGRDHVGEVSYSLTMRKVSLTIAPVFTTSQGRTVVLNTLFEMDLRWRYRMTDTSQEVAVLSDLMMAVPSVGETVWRLQNTLNRREDEKKPLVFFAHKFPDSASMAFRHLMKASFRNQWQLIRISPYKFSLNKAIRYARHEHYSDRNALTDSADADHILAMKNVAWHMPILYRVKVLLHV